MKTCEKKIVPGRARAAGVVALCAGLLVLAAGAEARAREPVQHVIVVSVDALLPEYYLPEGRGGEVAPTLYRLGQAGTVARRAYPPYPSLTYPGHATIATGVSPSRHGIVGNSLFEPSAQTQRGAWFARDMKTPAIWDVLAREGLTSAAVFWPVSARARNLKWNLPEFWTSHYGSEISLLRRYAKPSSLLADLEETLDGSLFHYLQPADRRDRLVALAGMEIFRRYKPGLLMIHFIETDKVQHQHGRGASRGDAVFSKADDYVREFWELVKEEGLEDQTILIVCGDHGFADIDRSIGPNVLFVREGLITLDEDGELDTWQVIANNTGNSAGIYLADDADEAVRARVREVLEDFAVDEAGQLRYTIVEGEEIRAVGGPRDAQFYLEGAPGVMFTGSLNLSWLDRRASVRGNHGGLPHDSNMAAGFLAMGPGIRQGGVIEEMHLMDIAPTIAAMFGVEFPDAEGRVLDELFE